MGTSCLLHLVQFLALGLAFGPMQVKAEDSYPTTSWPWDSTTRPWYSTTRPWYSTTRPWHSTTRPYPTTTAVPTEGCPPGWVDSIEGCFYFHYTQALTWTDAQYECERLGGFLAEPRTEEQGDLLKSLAFVEDAFVRVESWWIGLTDQGHEGRWIWQHEAENAIYTDWVPGSPSHGVNDADCAVMQQRDEYRWSDTDCTDTRAAPVCQRERGEDGPTTVWPPHTTPHPTNFTTSYITYYVNLEGGHTNYYEAMGNVFAVNRNGSYGPVCDDGWDYREARVVCRQLGYNYGTAYSSSRWGRVPDHMSMDDLNCNGQENYLQDCQHTTHDDCSGSEGAGVWCYKDPPTSTGSTDTTPWYAETDKESDP